MIVLWIVLGVVVLLTIALAVSYNRFVRQRNLVRESWQQIDVELQRRHDLIPNLVGTVQAYAAHERQVFEAITKARVAAEQARAQGRDDRQARANAENSLSRAVGSIVAVGENYPQLKADRNFRALQAELVDTEDRIAAGRRFYNGNARALNTRVEAFPSNLVARTFGFSTAAYFELDDPVARSAIRVDLGDPTR